MNSLKYVRSIWFSRLAGYSWHMNIYIYLSEERIGLYVPIIWRSCSMPNCNFKLFNFFLNLVFFTEIWFQLIKNVNIYVYPTKHEHLNTTKHNIENAFKITETIIFASTTKQEDLFFQHFFQQFIHLTNVIHRMLIDILFLRHLSVIFYETLCSRIT